jgi:hypothetical protein
LSLQHLSKTNTPPDLQQCLDHYSFQESLADVECLNCSYRELLTDKKIYQDIFQNCGSKDIGDIIKKIEFLDENSHQLDKVASELVNRVRTDASKQLRISRLPEVLCLHLSRRVFCAATGILSDIYYILVAIDCISLVITKFWNLTLLVLHIYCCLIVLQCVVG